MYEHSTTLDSDYGGGLSLSGEDTANLRKAGKWGRVLGILSMAFMGLLLLFIVFFGGTFLALSGIGDVTGGGVAMTMVLGFYALVLLLFFYLSYLLYKFGADAVAAVDQGRADSMTTSLSSLARLFKIYGIISIVYLGFVALGAASMLFTGAANLL